MWGFSKARGRGWGLHPGVLCRAPYGSTTIRARGAQQAGLHLDNDRELPGVRWSLPPWGWLQFSGWKWLQSVVWIKLGFSPGMLLLQPFIGQTVFTPLDEMILLQERQDWPNPSISDQVILWLTCLWLCCTALRLMLISCSCLACLSFWIGVCGERCQQKL